MRSSRKVAVVIDALPAYRGAERVLAAVLELYPEAEVHTLIYEPNAFLGTRIADHKVHTSFIQQLPGGKRHYRSLLPVLPLAIQGLDVGGADVVISLSYAVAHGVRCRPDQLHISYTFTPLRYAWQDSGKYFQHGPAAPAARLVMHFFRPWDRRAAQRVSHMAAISKWTAECIRQAYQREAEVIYPPVEIERFKPTASNGDYFVTFSRLVRQKRLELVVEAFKRLALPLVIIGEGPERRRLEALASPNVKFAGAPSSAEAARIVGGARALVHAAEEDFGLVMVEAQAAGRPVIAYRGGAAPEIVMEGKTGMLFAEQRAEDLEQAVRGFTRNEGGFAADACTANAARFSKPNFQRAFARLVEQKLELTESVPGTSQARERAHLHLPVPGD